MFLAAMLVVVVLAVIDISLGEDISLSLFYLWPVGGVTWYVSRSAGIFTAIFSTFAIVGQQYFNAPVLMSIDWVLWWHFFLRIGNMLVVIFILDKLHKQLIDKEKQARTDPLTGIWNRRTFMEYLTYVLHLAAREKMPIALTYIDVDDFKQINDRKGHAEGDRVLGIIAATLAKSVRSTDIVCRLGGDEFAVLSTDAGHAQAENLVLKLKNALYQAFHAEHLVVTCSIGCATFNQPPEDPDFVVRTADALMYQVKNDGKNRIAIAGYDRQGNVTNNTSAPHP